MALIQTLDREELGLVQRSFRIQSSVVSKEHVVRRYQTKQRLVTKPQTKRRNQAETQRSPCGDEC